MREGQRGRRERSAWEEMYRPIEYCVTFLLYRSQDVVQESQSQRERGTENVEETGDQAQDVEIELVDLVLEEDG